MNQVFCPYCESNIQKAAPDSFEACPSCGFRSARVASAKKAYLIIDSRLPDIIGEYHSLQQKINDCVVVIDRRVNHIPVAGNERRRAHTAG